MISTQEMKILVGLRIERLIFVVWPPFGEENKNDIDISIAFKFFEGGSEYVNFCTDKNDNWTLVEQIIDIKKPISGTLFEKKMDAWMEQSSNDIIDYEYFDLTENPIFDGIVGEAIVEIEVFSMKGDAKPFGVKFLFENDFLILLPNTDGSTVETKKFNCRNNISKFMSLGEFCVTKIQKII